MKRMQWIAWVGIACLSLACGQKQSDETPNSDQTAETPANTPANPDVQADQPPKMAEPNLQSGHVVATVGDAKIYSGEFDAMLANAPPGLPPEYLSSARQQWLNGRIQRELVRYYMDELPFDEAGYDAWRKDLIQRMAQDGTTLEAEMAKSGMTEENLKSEYRLDHMINEATSDQKVRQYIESNPVSYFDGTSVQARHILIDLPVYASQARREAARENLMALARKIEANEVTFAQAATDNSSCPSKEQGGDLGAFDFGRMVPEFAEAAFAMKTGQIAPAVESPFGLHLIQVTGRTEGTGELGADANNVARKALMSKLQGQILRESAQRHPVTILDAGPTVSVADPNAPVAPTPTPTPMPMPAPDPNAAPPPAPVAEPNAAPPPAPVAEPNAAMPD